MVMGWLQSSAGCLVLASGLLGLCVGSFFECGDLPSADHDFL